MSDVNAAQDAPDIPIEPANEYETKARRLGWVPKEEFRGDPDKWRPADEFLERGERILPLVLKDNDRLHARLTEVEGALKETKEAAKELLTFTSKSEERAYNRAKAEIEARIEAAASTADPNAVRQGMRELDALNADHRKVEPKPAQQTQTVQIDPVIQDWIRKEEWFSKSPALNSYATEVFGEIERNAPGMSRSDMLAETKRRTMDKFPEKFGINPNRDQPAAVASPSGAVQRKSRAKTYDDLPADAKKACDKFVRTIPGYTREKYVKDYDWDN
ncbi:MAG: hypothetical protein KGL39_20280 [Patescibacteria group bacterium]|nr:hypothetical protein [Patescibacteria group bacterium]